MTSAPNAFSASTFSFDCLSVVVKTHRYPLTTAAIARPMPVLPDVPSMIVPPGFSLPARSASSIIFTAMRSLIELPGLKVSILARTVPGTTPLVMRLMRTIGVSPIASRIVLAIFLTEQVYTAADASLNRSAGRRRGRRHQTETHRRVRGPRQLGSQRRQRRAHGVAVG